MSFLGPLGQLNLLDVVQRIEAHEKTGVLIVQQQERWVELYFRQGQLMCIGPVQSNSSPGDRLLQAGVISQQALQEAQLALGSSDISEMRMVLTLIDLGYVNHDRLYAWAAREATEIIQVLLTWTTGEIYFEDELQPPPSRLLIALSITSLLPSGVSTGPIRQSVHKGAPPTATLVREKKPEPALSSVSSPSTPPPLPIAEPIDPPKTHVSSQSRSNNSHQRVKIFICYAHEDELLLKRLQTHLRPLQRQRPIDVWHDRDISAGTEWKRQINQHLNTAQIILLLVSPDFMDSDYCYSVEMQRAIERHVRGEVRVIPIILRPTDWQIAPLNKLQALPNDGKPVTMWANKDQALLNIARGIRKTIEELTKKPAANPSKAQSQASKPVKPKNLQYKPGEKARHDK